MFSRPQASIWFPFRNPYQITPFPLMSPLNSMNSFLLRFPSIIKHCCSQTNSLPLVLLVKDSNHCFCRTVKSISAYSRAGITDKTSAIAIRNFIERIITKFHKKISAILLPAHSMNFPLLFKSLPPSCDAQIDNYCIPMFLLRKSQKLFMKTSFEKFFACFCISVLFQVIHSKDVIAVFSSSGVCVEKKIPVFHSTILSVAPHFP